jgi:uncharacterized protein with FMN-binding domain
MPHPEYLRKADKLKKLSASALLLSMTIAGCAQKGPSTPITGGAPAATQPANTAPTAVAAPQHPSSGAFVDGTYLGAPMSASRWGNVQVRVIVQGGAVTRIEIADYPNHTQQSNYISHVALPYLINETIQAQDAHNVNLISHATDTSFAYLRSLQTALDEASTGATG